MESKNSVSLNGQAGFSMIELLIAIMVLMVGVVAVAELIPRAVQLNFRNRNNSTSLIWAQRTIEQMAAQAIDVLPNLLDCTKSLPPAGHYAYCDEQGDGIALGRISPGVVTPDVFADGCPLDGTGESLDFSGDVTVCPPGYSLTRQVLWDVNMDTYQPVEIRWAVVSMHMRGTPVRKVLIVGARLGLPGQGFVVRNLKTTVGR